MPWAAELRDRQDGEGIPTGKGESWWRWWVPCLVSTLFRGPWRVKSDSSQISSESSESTWGIILAYVVLLLTPRNPPDISKHQKIRGIAVFYFLDTASLLIPCQLSETYQVTDLGGKLGSAHTHMHTRTHTGCWACKLPFPPSNVVSSLKTAFLNDPNT